MACSCHFVLWHHWERSSKGLGDQRGAGYSCIISRCSNPSKPSSRFRNWFRRGEPEGRQIGQPACRFMRLISIQNGGKFQVGFRSALEAHGRVHALSCGKKAMLTASKRQLLKNQRELQSSEYSNRANSSHRWLRNAYTYFVYRRFCPPCSSI